MDPDYLLEESLIQEETIEETLRNNPSEGQALKEEKRSIENSLSENELVIPEREEITSVTRRPKEETSSHNTPFLPQISARSRRLAYDKRMRKNLRKESQLANS